MSTMESEIATDIQQGLALAATILPQLVSLPAWVIPVIEAAMQGVAIVAKDTGAPAAAAASQVVSHLTPGAPAAPSLN